MSLRSTFTLFTAAAGIVFATSIARADTSTTTDTTPPPSTAQHAGKRGAGRPTAGKIVSFDAQSGALVLQPRSGTNLTVYVDAQTKVTVDGKAAAATDLKANERVMVTASGANDHRTAVSVAVQTGGKAKGAGA